MFEIIGMSLRCSRIYRFRLLDRYFQEQLDMPVTPGLSLLLLNYFLKISYETIN